MLFSKPIAIRICEVDRRLNPVMHVREVFEGETVRVTLCGWRALNDCPYVPISHWGDPDRMAGTEDRQWCPNCQKKLKQALRRVQKNGKAE